MATDTRFLSLLCGLMLALQGVQARSLVPAQETEAVRLRTELVLLNVEVINKRTGERIGNLRKEDFFVYEDGTRRPIEHFQRHDLPHRRRPLSLVLMVCPVDMSMIDSVEVIERVAQYSLEGLWEEDEVALMVFAARAHLLQELTTDKELIREKLSLVSETEGIGASELIDEAIYQAAVYLEKASHPLNRRVILVVMSGNLLSARFFKGHSPKAALKAVYRSNALVYGILVHTPVPLEWRFLKWWMKANPVNFGLYRIVRGGTLKKYVEATGGEIIEIGQEEVATLLPEVIGRIQSRYTLGYVPANRKRDGRFRRIKVRVAPWVEKENGRVLIRVRRGYIAR